MHGPFSRFFYVASNGNKEELIIAVCPHSSTLNFLRGYRFGKGWFDEYNFEGSVEFEWDRSAQLTAATESGVAYNTIDRPFTGVSPNRVGTIASDSIQFSYDEDGIDPQLSRDSGVLRIDEYIWKDDWLQRRVTSNNGATPADYVYSKCLMVKEFGSCETGLTDLSGIRVIDEHASKDYLNGQKLHRAVKDSVTVYVPKRGGNDIEPRVIDMTPLLKGQGDYEFMPAFTEFTQLPRAVLFKERPEEESLVHLQCGLTREEVLQGTLAIRLTLNYALLTQALGSTAMAISEASVINIARALSTRKKEV
jgi:hypothetical protein